MATNALDLLFRIRADGSPAAAEIATLKKRFATELKGVEQLVTKPLRVNVEGSAKITDPFARINQTLEKGRQEFVASTIKASEQATAGIVSGLIKQDQALKQTRNTLGRAADAHVRYFKETERVGKSVSGLHDAHVKLFKAQQAVLPQMDAHVQAFRRIEKETAAVAKQTLSLDQVLGRVGGSLRNLGLGMTSLGASLSVGLTLPLAALSAFASQSAKDIDTVRNRLIATEGSVDAANKRLERLRQLAQESVGVTSKAANDSFALLSTVGGLTEQTIERQIKALGRLNAAFTIDDQQLFFRNLIQIFTQGFEIKDIKEALGRVPIFNQLLEEAFNTSDPEALRQLKKSGQLTLDVFMSELAGAVERDRRLSQIGESITTRLQKALDRVSVAFAPVGDAILRVLENIIARLEPAVTAIAGAFAALPQPLQTVIVLFGGVAAAIGPVLFIAGQLATGVGGLISAFGRLHALGIAPSIQSFETWALRMKGAEEVTKALQAAQAQAAATTVRFAAAKTGAVAATSRLAASNVVAATTEAAFTKTVDAHTAATGRLVIAQRAAAISTGAFAASLVTGLAVTAGIGIALGLVVAAISGFGSAQERATKVTEETVRATAKHVQRLEEQQKSLREVREGTTRTADEQKKLSTVYSLLDRDSVRRVERLKAEGKEVSALSEELRKLIEREKERQGFQGVGLAKQFEEDLVALREFEAQTRATNRILREHEAEVDRLNARRAAGEQLTLSEARRLDFLQGRIEGLLVALGRQEEAEEKAREKAEGLANAMVALSDVTGRDLSVFFDRGRALGQNTLQTEALTGAVRNLSRSEKDASDETKRFTAATDEQVESLRRLKRALQEAEIAARSRSEAARRAFDEERVSGAQFTEEQIAGTEARRKAQLDELDEFLRVKRESLAGLDPQAQKRTNEEIERAELDRKKIITETADEIENLRSQQRLRERDELTRNREAIIAIDREAAEAQIDILRDQIELDESLRLENEQKIVRLERRITQAEVDEAQRRLNLAAAGTEARARLEDELDARIARQRRQRGEQERRLRDAQLAKDLRAVEQRRREDALTDLGDEGVIARLRDAAERGRNSFEVVEQSIRAIVDDGFERRVKRLKEEIEARKKFGQDVTALTHQLNELEKERSQAFEEGSRNILDGFEREMERRREIANQGVELAHALARSNIAVREAILKATENVFAGELTQINRRYALEREQIEQAGREAESALFDREHDELLFAEKSIADTKQREARKLEIERTFNELRRQEQRRTALELKALEDERLREAERRNPLSSRSLLGDTFADAVASIREGAAETGREIGTLTETMFGLGTAAGEVFAQMSADAGNFFSIAVAGVGQLIQGVGDLVANWVLLGETGPAALRKLLASIIAHYAKAWIIKALDLVAEGFSYLAKASAAAASGNVLAAALYKNAAVMAFVSAAKYGLAGAAAAVVGRAVAGGSGGGGAGAGTGSGFAGEREPRNQQFNFNAQVVEPSSTARRDGSAAAGQGSERGGLAGMLERAVRTVAEEQERRQAQRDALVVRSMNEVSTSLAPFKTATPDEVVMKGAEGASVAIEAAVLQRSKENHAFGKTLAEDMGIR